MESAQQSTYQDPYKAGTHRTNPWFFASYVGFFAGLIWGLVKIVCYWFEFSRLHTAFFVSYWYEDRYLNGWQGNIVGLFWIVVISIAASLLYASLLRKIRGPWAGLGYGLAWWAILFIWLGPWTGVTENIFVLDRNTFWTELSLFALWGTFIGYSISFEFTDEQSRDSDRQVMN